MTKRFPVLVSMPLALAAFFGPGRVYADALPNDQIDCDVGRNTVGGTCNAYDANSTKGTCQASRCQRFSTTACDAGGPDASTQSPDGGLATRCAETVDCMVCVPGSSSSSGGCAVMGANGDLFSMLAPLGLAALVPLAMRRRRSK